MRKVLALLFVSLASLAVPARADVPMPPRVPLGTPAPRAVTTPEGSRPAPVPWVAAPWWWRQAPESTVDHEPAARDPGVTMRSERVALTFLRNLVWVRSTIVLRATEADVADWPMGIADHQWRFHARPVLALEVRADGEARPIRYRTLPARSPGPEASPGFDAWFEWRVDVPADRDVRVDVSCVVPAHWLPAQANGEPWHGHDRGHGLVQPFDYELGYGRSYGGGRGRARLTARTVGYRARFRRVRRAGEPMIDLGERVTLDLGDERDRVQLLLAWPDSTSPPRPARLGAGVPAWLALLDRSLYAFPFSPTPERSSAPGFTAGDFEAMVTELLERAEHGEGREREVARGLLAALRERLAEAAEDPSAGYDRPLDDESSRPSPDAGPLPSPEDVGRLGGALDADDWIEAIEGARRWLLPQGEALEPLVLRDVPEWLREPEAAAPAREHRGSPGRAPRWQEPSDEPYERTLHEDARALGLRTGPPFGLPNQLVLASRRRSSTPWWTGLAVVAVLCAGAYALVRRRRDRRSRTEPSSAAGELHQ